MFREDRREIYHIYVYAIFNGLLSLVLPFGIQTIINLIQSGKSSSSWMFVIILVTLSVVFSGVLQIFQLRIVENLQQKIFYRAAMEFTYRIPKLNLSKIPGKYPPELVNRFFDILTIQKGLPKLLIDVTTAVLQIFFGLLLLSFYHAFFIAFSLVLLVLLYLLLRYTSFKGMTTAYDESTQKYKVAFWLQEVARSLSAFKVFGKANFHFEKSDDLTADYLTGRESHFKILIKQFIQLIGFKVLITLSLLLIGGLLVINQQMNIGQFVASELIILLVINSVEKLIMSLETVYDVLVGLEKVGSFTDLPLDRQDLPSEEEEVEVEQEDPLSITFKDVSYRSHFDDRTVIKDMTAEVSPQARTAVIGGKVSGKSVFLNVLAGVNSDYEGSFLINKVTKRNHSNRKFLSHVAYCDGYTDIFTGTIRDNIIMGRPIADRDMFAVCEQVQLLDFINNTEKGFDTELLPEGKYLSQNVKLKITLARALAGKPKLIVLENFLDKLFVQGELQVIDYLLDSRHPWAVVAEVQHRQLLEHFSEVLVFESGRMIGAGELRQVEGVMNLNEYLYA